MHSRSADVVSKHVSTKSSSRALAASTHASHASNAARHDPPFMYLQNPHVSSSSSSSSRASLARGASLASSRASPAGAVARAIPRPRPRARRRLPHSSTRDVES